MRTLTLSLLFLALAVSAMAQTPRAEISGGWSFLVDESNQHPLGFQICGGWRLTDSFALVGDFAWNELTEIRLPEFRKQGTVTTLSAGPRFYFGEDVTGFVHVLVGVIRLKHTTSEPPEPVFTDPFFFGPLIPNPFLGLSFPERTDERVLLIQPGGGVDIPVSDRFAIRLQGDYHWMEDVSFAPPWYVRFVAGAVFYAAQH